MKVFVKRGFNLVTGSYANWGHPHDTLLQLGPGVCEVPDKAAEHWYFIANVREKNITIIEQNDAAPVAPVAA